MQNKILCGTTFLDYLLWETVLNHLTANTQGHTNLLNICKMSKTIKASLPIPENQQNCIIFNNYLQECKQFWNADTWPVKLTTHT